MKKLFAILVSAILLCAMIPFATVSAADEPTIVVAPSKDVVNAGEEFTVSVSLMNNPGVISAVLEIEYDSSVLELLTHAVYNADDDEYYDENKIELGSGWSRSYYTPSPFGVCCVSWINGTAKKNVEKELFFTASFKVKDDAKSGTYPLTIKYEADDLYNIDFDNVDFGVQNASITINGVCEHNWTDATCTAPKTCSKCNATEGEALGHTAGAAADCTTAQLCTVCNAVLNEALGHNYSDATCTAPKTCSVCGATEGDPLPHSYEAVVTDPTCTAGGYTTYTCACGDSYIADETEALPHSYEAVVTDPTCENGGYTTYTCACGDSYVADETDPLGHTYDSIYDADCNECGAVRDIVLGESDIIIKAGNSVSEDKAGLAFKFDVYASGITFNEKYEANYDNATVKVNGVEYKLVEMGAILNNQGEANLDLDAVNGSTVLKVKADKAFSLVEGATEADSFAVRVLKLDTEEKKAKEIIARPYFIYENAEGEQIAGYGEDWSASYASVIAG